MLFIVSIPAAVIALIFSYFDVVNSLGVPSVSHNSFDLGFVHYLKNYLATTLILVAMIWALISLHSKQ